MTMRMRDAESRASATRPLRSSQAQFGRPGWDENPTDMVQLPKVRFLVVARSDTGGEWILKNRGLRVLFSVQQIGVPIGV